MAALRGVWIVAKKQQELIFTRRFPNVEQRCSRERTDTWPYVPIPRDDDFVRLFLRAWLAASDVELSDRICVHVGPLWPVVFLEQEDYVYFTVAKVADLTATTTALLDHIEVSVALAFLQDVASFTRQLIQEDGRELYEKIAELNLYINFAAPFGQPQDVPLTMIRTLFRIPFTDKQLVSTGQKQPPWKPYNPRGKQQLTLTFREEIRAVQYDSTTTPDIWEVSGTVLCKAELEGVPDVTIALVLGSVGTMSSMAVHPCVQAEDFVQTRKIVFSPPTELFALCHYKINDVPYLPLRGFYQMKEIDSTSVKVLVQLKLSDKVHNNFEYCQLSMPFSHRGPIVQLDVSPTTGTVSLSPNRQTLIWNIGQKFTGRNREVALPGTIFFQGATLSNGTNTTLPSTTTSTSTSLFDPNYMTQQLTSQAGLMFGGNQTAAGPLTVVAGSIEMDHYSGPATMRTSSGSTTTALDEIYTKEPLSSTTRPPRYRPLFDEVEENNDPFCTNETAFVKIRFKLAEDNISGCTVDPQSVALYPNARVKLSTSRELVSLDYVIWNSLGDARVAMVAPTPAVPL